MNALKLWLAQYRLYAEIAAVILIGIAIALFIHHERWLGEDRQIQRDAVAVQKQREAVAAQEFSDRKAIQARSESYEAQLQALQHDLDTKPASVVRVCHNASPGPVREAPAAASGPVDASSAGLGGSQGRDSQEGQSVDVGPDLDRYATDAQALALRCQAVIDLWPK